MTYPFNVRVYGILIENNKVLLSDEYFRDTFITKFPGGGLDFGEGPIDCVKREFREELGLEIKVISHFYTTDFFQASAFNPGNQVISIYYLIKVVGGMNIKSSVKKFDFPEIKNHSQSFRWIDLKDLTAEEMTFPIDRKVASMLIENTTEN